MPKHTRGGALLHTRTPSVCCAQDLPALLVAQTRQYVAPMRLDFTDEVTSAKVRCGSVYVCICGRSTAPSGRRSRHCAAPAPTNAPAVCCLQSSKEATSLLDEWKSKKAGTEQALKLLQAYKDLGDSKGEVRACGRVGQGREGGRWPPAAWARSRHSPHVTARVHTIKRWGGTASMHACDCRPWRRVCAHHRACLHLGSRGPACKGILL